MKEKNQGAAAPRDAELDRCGLCGEERLFHPTRKQWRHRSPHALIGHLFVVAAGVQGKGEG